MQLLPSGATQAQPTLNPNLSGSFSTLVDLVSGDLEVAQLAFGPDGRLYASTFANGIWRFDYDPQGPLANGTQVSPIGALGIAFHRSDLNGDGSLDSVMYLSQSVPSASFDPTINHFQSIIRLTDFNGDGIWGGAGDVHQAIVDNLRVTELHQTNQLQVQGDSLYVAVGSRTRTGGEVMEYPSVTGDDGEFSYTGAINFIEDLNLLTDVVTPNTAGFAIQNHSTDTQGFLSGDPSKLRVFSTGFRNPFGIAFDRHGELWVSMNENDPPFLQDDVLHRSEFRADHGFPKRNPDVVDWKLPNASGPSAEASQAGYFQTTKAPFALLGRRTAVGGLDFVSTNVEFLDHIVVSRFRIGDVVAVDPITGGLILLAAGFLNPLDVLADPEGNLLIAEFGPFDVTTKTRSIFRISVVPNLPVIAGLADDWVNAAAGWSYFASDAVTGGSLTPLQSDQPVGDASARGFGGTSTFGTPAIIGDNADGGEYELFADGEVNGGIVGTHVLVHPGRVSSSEPVLVLRYIFDAADLLGSDLVRIEGDFRNLPLGDDSVSVFVFHNDQLLFEAEGRDPGGSDGDPRTLSAADGSFRVEGLSVSAGDAIDFVVDPNENFFGDETSVRARIVPEPSANTLAASALRILYAITRRQQRYSLRSPRIG